MHKYIQQKKNYLIWLNRERVVPDNSNIELILFLTLSLLLLLLAQFRSSFEVYRSIRRYISTFNCKGLKISYLDLFTALKLGTGKAYNGKIYI